MIGYHIWIRLFTAVFLFGFSCNTAIADKPRASLSRLEISPSIAKSDLKIINQLNIAKKFREGLVDSGLFAVHSRNSRELQDTIQREKELAESGLAGQQGGSGYQYTLTSYFFIPRIMDFSACSIYSEIPHIKGVYDRKDVGKITLHLTAMGGSDKDEILFEETGTGTFSLTYEYESDKKPAGGRPAFSRLEKMTGKAIDKILKALDSRVNPITIYHRYKDVVLINRGRNSGFKIGDRMIVFSPPKEWTNPNTGVTSRMPGMNVGEVEITRIDEKSSQAVVVSDNGIEPSFILEIK
jgi:hypothetical protein